MRSPKMTGYTAAIISTVLLGAVGIFVRNISVNAYVITFVRLGFGAAVLVFILCFKKEITAVKSVKFSFSLLATGILMALTSLCYINAINSIPLASATFLLYLAPLIAVGLAAVLLKERFTWINGALLGLAFLGFLFLLEFKFVLPMRGSEGYGWGIGSAVCYALFIVLNRNMPVEMPALTRSFFQLSVGALVVVPFLDSSILNLTSKDFYWLMAIGVFHGCIALPLVVLALKNLKAVEYGTISYIEPLVASLVGFTLYAESLTPLQFIGCAIVLFGGMIQVVTANKG